MYDHEFRRKAREEFRDFWCAWREQRHAFKHGFKHSPADNPDLKDQNGMPDNPDFQNHEGPADAWREFFHNFMGSWPEKHWIFGGRRFSPWWQGMDSFNPLVASLLSKGGGLLPMYILHLISQKPRYGNEIMEILAEDTGGQWMSNPGAVYPLLALLERQGFIEGKWEDPQKRSIRIYSITKTGEEELAKIKAVMAPKIAETIKVLQGFIQGFDSSKEPAEDASTPPPK
jgi:DNA-binding PadR family transcriptional regulator